MKKIQLGKTRRGAKYSGETIVDDEDFERLNKYNWSLTHEGYATSLMGGKRRIKMHRFIMSAKFGQVIDHINRDTSDNRKQNLRVTTHTKNLYNRPKQKNNKSGYKGVFKSGKGWGVIITHNKKHYWLGSFQTKKEAAKTYNKSAKKYFGSFAYLNTIKS